MIQIEIQINKVFINDTELLNNYPLKSISAKPFPLKHHLEYKLDESDMNIIKNTDKYGIKSMCSKILSDYWSITIYPNGTKNEDTKGYLTLFFRIVKWPKAIKTMKLFYNVKSDKEESVDYESTDDFNDQDRCFMGVDCLISLNSLKKHDTFTFIMDIDVLNTASKVEEVFIDEYEITDPAKITYLLSD